MVDCANCGRTVFIDGRDESHQIFEDEENIRVCFRCFHILMTGWLGRRFCVNVTQEYGQYLENRFRYRMIELLNQDNNRVSRRNGVVEVGPVESQDDDVYDEEEGEHNI